jgi:hypothetical protein
VKSQFLTGFGDVNGKPADQQVWIYCLPQDLQEKRIKTKPGLIPPHVSLRLKGFAGVIKAERQYLEERENHPIRTDIKYFFLAIFNILTLRAKSS